MSDFNREDRYCVLKRTDIKAALSYSQQEDLKYMLSLIEEHRQENAKPPLECVVVESDWPMYEDTWNKIESYHRFKAAKDEFMAGQPLPEGRVTVSRFIHTLMHFDDSTEVRWTAEWDVLDDVSTVGGLKTALISQPSTSTLMLKCNNTWYGDFKLSYRLPEANHTKSYLLIEPYSKEK